MLEVPDQEGGKKRRRWERRYSSALEISYNQLGNGEQHSSLGSSCSAVEILMSGVRDIDILHAQGSHPLLAAGSQLDPCPHRQGGCMLQLCTPSFYL